MSFFKEAGNALGLDWAKLAMGYQLVNYNGEAVYIEGVKRILSIDDTLVALHVGKKLLHIVGENLEIHDVSGAAIMIKGTITACILPESGGGNEKKGKAKTNDISV